MAKSTKDVAGAINKERRRLEHRLDTAVSQHAKRLRQLATAEASKGKKQVAKRRLQVDDAAKQVTSLTEKLAVLAGSAAGKAARAPIAAARTARGAAKSAGVATARAAAGGAKAAGSAARAARAAGAATTRAARPVARAVGSAARTVTKPGSKPVEMKPAVSKATAKPTPKPRTTTTTKPRTTATAKPRTSTARPKPATRPPTGPDGAA